MKAPAKVKKRIQDLTHNDVPASVGLVKKVRSELRADIRSLDSKLDSVEHKLISKIEAVDSKIGTVDSKLETILASVHRTEVLVEEQRGENRIVLDGIKNLTDRHERLETEFSEIRKDYRFIKR